MGVRHTMHDMAGDLAGLPAKVDIGLARAVRKNVEQGNAIAQGIARAASGPHGSAYYKRITGEMTGAHEGEYGPHGDVAGNAVGAGWRSGVVNTDLDKSLDIQGPKFAKDVGDVVDGIFW